MSLLVLLNPEDVDVTVTALMPLWGPYVVVPTGTMYTQAVSSAIYMANNFGFVDWAELEELFVAMRGVVDVKKYQLEEPDTLAAKVEPVPMEMVEVEALMRMWADNDVVLPGTRYHLPVEAAEYLANMGFVAIVATKVEEAVEVTEVEEAG